MKPLDGIRVVEVAGFVFVPLAGSIMADLGADVIKVEPRGGDLMRGTRTAQARFADDDGPTPPSSLLAEFANRGKRSITLDLSQESGREVLRRLVHTADVFSTSYLEGVRQRLRIDVADIHAINPSVIYARGSGWGAAGPMRNAPAFDLASAWAGSGIADALTDSQGEPPSMPIGIFDVQAANSLAGAIGIALFQRLRTGVATVVDTSLLNVGMWAGQTDIAAAPHRIPVGRTDRRHPYNALVNWYRTADARWIFFVMMRAGHRWAEMCDIIDRPDLATDERFSTDTVRADNAAACAAILDEVFATATLDEWRARFDGFEGCWGPMLKPEELHQHPQTAPNGFLTDHVTNTGFQLKLVAPPMHFGDRPTASSGPAPEVGQHTELLLLDLGYSWDEIGDLADQGVIGPE